MKFKINTNINGEESKEVVEASTALVTATKILQFLNAQGNLVASYADGVWSSFRVQEEAETPPAVAPEGSTGTPA